MEATAMSTIIAAMSDAYGLVATVITTITGQPLLLFYVAVGLIPVGIGVFRQLKRAARG